VGYLRYMDDKIYSLQEAAALLGWDYERLKTMARREKFPTVDITYGKERTRKGITQAVLEELQGERVNDKYTEMVALCVHEMRSGVWDGKGLVLTEEWVTTVENYLDRYWEILGVNKTILGVSAINFKQVMSSFGIDRDKKRDYHSTKMHIYKAITALMKVLIREGFKKKEDLQAIRAFRPGKVFKLKKDFLDLADIEKALELNKFWIRGRSEFDRRAFDILISLYAYAGLRRMEAVNLRLDQVHLSKGYLHVYGKWAKERIVPIFPALADRLTDWLSFRAQKNISFKLLVPQRDGSLLTKTAIATRFRRLKEHADKKDVKGLEKLTPHALRRSCATIASIHGMPDGLIQRMLGHKHATTTEGYKQVQDRHLVEWAQNFEFRKPLAMPPATEEASLPAEAQEPVMAAPAAQAIDWGF
jgi:integrase